jgi:hypothetical protein
MRIMHSSLITRILMNVADVYQIKTDKPVI